MTPRDDLFLDTDLIAYAPCGCWFAVMIESRDFAENAERTAQFVRNCERSGGGRIERIQHSEFGPLRNGVNGDLKVGCDHEPKWGGLKSTHRHCPRCGKDVKIKKDGTLAAHKGYGYPNCTQEPWPKREATSVSGDSAVTQ